MSSFSEFCGMYILVFTELSTIDTFPLLIPIVVDTSLIALSLSVMSLNILSTSFILPDNLHDVFLCLFALAGIVV
ncbi:hypothetical protein AR158_c464R [Paramecium bursaria Chlorella virus AR158]|uniref:hypothetical protein n=1 Tax=Paramecium bursaria Chlorella virus AR158 TaxID=380598 RepID=UPI00015AA6EE|nr:hypothetical protein AR158_c464R [Paramecium bursaria Chlorella virus AR158]ABU44009.1 hypothetical protein AR158_c464R [Paramecium bursaria Chlorella virus AR158]